MGKRDSTRIHAGYVHPACHGMLNKNESATNKGTIRDSMLSGIELGKSSQLLRGELGKPLCSVGIKLRARALILPNSSLDSTSPATQHQNPKQPILKANSFKP